MVSLPMESSYLHRSKGATNHNKSVILGQGREAARLASHGHPTNPRYQGLAYGASTIIQRFEDELEEGEVG